MTYDTLTIDELRYALLQRDEQLRSALEELNRLKHEHVTDMVKADLELAQAQAALRYAVAVSRFSRSHDWPEFPSSEFAEFSTLLDALDTKLRAAGLIEQKVEQTDTPCIEYDEAICEKLQGWLSPDEAKRLEAQCAAQRERLQELLQVCDSIDDETGHQTKATEQALSTTAGTDLLDRLAKAEEQLKEAMELLECAEPRSLAIYSGNINWHHRRDAFLAEQKACP